MTVNGNDLLRQHWIADLNKYLFEHFEGSKVVDICKDNFYLLMWTAFVAFIVFIMYYCLFLPSNYKWDLSDVGFDYLTDGYYRSARHIGKNKRTLVREVQKLRKIGDDLPPVYPNGWFALLESEELKKNEVKYVAALGENFAVFRNNNGDVKILDAYCPHLGANMAIGGKIRGNGIECPFHSWMFDGDTGHCSSVPYAEKTPNFAKVKKWESIEVNDYIFVWYHSENEEPSWYPEEVLRNKKWTFHGRSEFLVGCHIQETEEIVGDVNHHDNLHSASFLGGEDLRFYEKWYFNFMRHSYRYSEWKEDPDKRHIGVVEITAGTYFFNKFYVPGGECSVRLIGPGILEIWIDTPLGPVLFLQSMTPIEALLQKVTKRVYAPYKAIIMAKFLFYCENLMVKRDVMVWNHKTYQQKPILPEEDKSIATFRRWYNQFYSENSARFQFQKDTLAW